jgi:hypothetical protein
MRVSADGADRRHDRGGRDDVVHVQEANVKEKGGDVFAVRCFRNGRRRVTHTLTKKEARWFRLAARTLSRYLTKEYRLGPENRRRT